MSLDQHTIVVPSGSAPANTDRILIGNIPAIVNGTAAAGVTVTVAVAMSELPASYSVQINPGQGCAAYADGKTATGFNAHLVPLSAALVIAAGTFDVTVVA